MHLFLVRHGDSPFVGATDHERPLSDHGIKQAQQAGHFIQQQMSAHQLAGPDALMLCSDAHRTQTTAQTIQAEIGCDGLLSDRCYYGALVGQWCDAVLQNARQKALILVGHNPTISYLGNHLSPMFNHGFSPACVAHFSLEIDPDGLRLPAQLIQFFTPNVE